jgi:hypothetical protein
MLLWPTRDLYETRDYNNICNFYYSIKICDGSLSPFAHL